MCEAHAYVCMWLGMDLGGWDGGGRMKRKEKKRLQGSWVESREDRLMRGRGE